MSYNILFSLILYFASENFKKINSQWSGNVEVSNVLALIRHTFNDFSDLQVKLVFLLHVLLNVQLEIFFQSHYINIISCR